MSASDDGDELASVLREAQLLLIQHPVAAHALARAFMAEGRAFAATEAGAEWRRRLERSELIRRGRVVWEVVTMNLFEDDSPSVLPSKILDAVLAATGIPDLEPTLARLFERSGAAAGV